MTPTLPDDVASRLRCVECGARLSVGSELSCSRCEVAYPQDHGVWLLLTNSDRERPEFAFYSADDAARFGRTQAQIPPMFREPVMSFIRAIPADDLIVEIGVGRGGFDTARAGYVALDYSLPALRGSGATVRICANAETLPFVDRSIAAILSVATLEHVARPELAMAEIDRCLAPGGQVFLFPAWFVRPWASQALHVRRYGELSPVEKLAKASVLIRDRRPYQFLSVLPGRLAREWRLLRRSGPQQLTYKRLNPNLDEFLVSDSDAFASLDPHAVASYFLSRGYEIDTRTSIVRRLLYGYEPVVAAKPR